jgi:5-methylcytosine-specific restriction endonuclease McrA
MPNPISKARLDAFHKQAGLCFYCKSRMWLKDVEYFALKYAISKSAAARFQCTAEHLTARCDGGNNSKKNIVAACFFCNNNRHRRKVPPAPDKYKAQIQMRLKQGKWHPNELQHIVSM